jgi:Tfp pilus assembly protein PilE
MRSRQRGATFLGMLVIVAIIGFGLFAGIRLVPLYMEYMAVVRAMEQTAKENAGGTQETLRTSLIRRWAVEDIQSIQPKDIQIQRAAKGFVMRAWYRAEAPFVSNISLVVDFDKSVTVGGSTLAGT